MKIKTITLALPLAALLAVSPLQAGWKGGKPGAGGQGNTGTQVTTALSDAEAATLVFMREEEKLARDVYITLFDQWQHPVFNNISGSEQRHMDSMKSKIDKYGLVDPVTDDTVGVFQNEELSTLYRALVDRGNASLEEALHVGGYIEELDIGDLEEAIAESSHADVVQAYENLERGSRNHLRAFVGQIENLGIVYEAQLMSQEEVDAIVNSATERGGKGRGKRRGGR
ncbi:MAG TPA: DUF2202 domain-containing protein [Thiolapillus brandeum]|uniref:DUF2202 domain-containing protein n=1 Tax=Thiolapillus brandeum TaxID=1076588 RepID=A0A831RZ14_9GAMM|nr:DUF2202 domain-containing protein [Thiolapillus brandeum]